MKTSFRDTARQARRTLHNQLSDKEILSYEQARLDLFFSHDVILRELDRLDVNIGCYVSMGSEASTHLFRETLFSRGFQVSVPVLSEHKNAGEMGFVSISSTSPFEVDIHRFPQPPNWCEAHLVFPDIVIVPLLAFDINGHRLGYGKGHYDRFFAKEQNHPNHPPFKMHRSLRVGFAYERQLMEELPTFETDLPLDLVITEHKVWSFQKSPFPL